MGLYVPSCFLLATHLVARAHDKGGALVELPIVPNPVGAGQDGHGRVGTAGRRQEGLEVYFKDL